MEKLLLLTFCLILTNGSFAVTVNNIKDIRLQKAMLAYGRGNISLTNRYLKRNLKGEFHLPTYLFLARSYKENSRNIKAIRVYYQAIKKSDRTDFLSAGNIRTLKKRFKERELAPSDRSLDVYYKIAKTFSKMRLKTNSKSDKDWYQRLSIKYFFICKQYRYNQEKSRYNLGVLQFDSKGHSSKLNFKKSGKRFNDKDEDASIAMLGTSINKNRDSDPRNIFSETADDAATIMLRRAYLKSTPNTALNRYAENYLDHMGEREFSFDATMKVGRHSNIGRRVNDSVKKVSSFFYKYEADAYLSKGFLDQWKIYFVGNFERSRYYWPAAVSYGAQVLDGSGTIQYDNIKKTLVKLTYRIKSCYIKDSNNKLIRFSRLKEVHPFINYSLSSGMIGYHLLYSKKRLKHVPSIKTVGYGGGISFVPFLTTKYFSPSYEVFYRQFSQKDINYKYNEIDLSFSNHFDIHRKFSLLLELDYQMFSSSIDQYSSHQNSTKLTLTYKPPLKSLSILGEFNHIISNSKGFILSDTDYNAHELVFMTGLTISF